MTLEDKREPLLLPGSQSVSLLVRCVPWKQQIVESNFFPQSASPRLFIGDFKLFTFMVIIKRCFLMSVILLLVVFEFPLLVGSQDCWTFGCAHRFSSFDI